MKKVISLFLLLGILLCIFLGTHPSPVSPEVKVDFSQYQKQEERTALYTRLSPEPLTELVPSRDYGTIYPYIGGKKTYLWAEYGTVGSTKFQYGFVDATGRILVDPVYDQAELLRIPGSLGLPFWVIGKNVYSESANDSDILLGLAAIDGSYVGPLIYRNITARENCILGQLPYNHETEEYPYHILDARGNLLLTTESIALPGRVCSLQYVGEDLFLIGLAYDFSGNVYYHFMDWEGNLLYGPYISAEPYFCGWAAVKTHEETWTYIDPAGKEMGRYFTECTSFQEGYALVKTGYSYQVIKQDGTIVVSSVAHSGADFLSVTSHGLYISPLGDAPHWYYSFQGELLFETTRIDWLQEELIYADYGDPSAPYLYDIRQDLKIPLPAMEEGHRLELLLYGDADTPVIVVRDRNWYSWEAVDSYYSSDYKLLWVSEPYRTISPTKAHLVLEQVGKEAISYPVLPGENDLTLYGTTDATLNSYPLSDFIHCRLYDGGYLTLTDDFSTRMYDPQGNLIFSYPFTALMED